MNFLIEDSKGKFQATEAARLFLNSESEFALTGYLGLSAQSPAVTSFLEAIERHVPSATTESGTAFTFRSDKPSAMDDPDFARFLTMSLAGRGRCVAPVLAQVSPPRAGETTLLDIGGGSGFYSIAYRLECIGGDMFTDNFPVQADILLVSNILHDWDVPEIHHLLKHWHGQCRENTRLILHDVYLNDALDGPLPIALYSADLFYLTEGRAYSRSEYLQFFRETGWRTDSEQKVQPTSSHCGTLEAVR